MPIVEAMASGTPVVAFIDPLVDEACGDAALRSDPDSAEAIATSIGQALAELELLVKRGFAHASRFTSRACGEALLHGYESVAPRDARSGKGPHSG